MLILNWLSSAFGRATVFVLLLFFSSCNFISNKILTKPVVRIEQYQLTTQDFSKQLAHKLKDLDALSAKDPRIVDFYKNQVVNDFVVSSFINLWFEEKKLSLSKDEVARAINSVVASYPSSSEFREVLSESDISYASWVEKIKVDLKKKKLMSFLLKGLAQPKEDELQEFYNNNRIKYEQVEAILLSHIHVNDLNQADVVKNLARKQNFTALAKKYSKSYNAESKDVYGWVEKSFSPEFEKAFKRRVGEVFGPVTLSDGIHMFKVVQKRPNKVLSFSEVKPLISSEILSLRETARFTAWLDEQIKKYKVKKNLGIIDSVRVETR